jgi:hypothetical protein
MTPTLTIEIPADSEALVRRLLALHEELQALALSAPDGTVFDACETAVLAGGRQVQQQMLEEALARRIEAAEKRGRRCAPAPAAGPRKTAVPKPGSC